MDDEHTLFATIELFLADAKFPSLGDTDKWSFPAPKPSQPQPPPRPMPVKERRKRHIEIQLLRDQVAQLEALRAVLAKRQSEVQDSAASPSSAVAEWKAVAVDELQKREQAMAINLELRKLVRSRVELARRVHKQVGQQQKLIHREVSPDTQQPGDPLHLFPHEPSIYSHLDAQTHKLYERTDHALRHPQLPTLHSLVARLRDVRALDGSPFLDAIDARLVPFDLEATAHAVWHWLRSAHHLVTHHRVLHLNVVDDHTMLASFAANLDTAPQCHGNLVVRRFDEPDRVVFVRAMLADPRTTGFAVRHSEWIVLYRPVDATQHVLPRCTEIIVRDLAEQDAASPRIDNRLHSVIAHQLTKYLDLMHEFVDNALLEIH